MNLVVVEAFQSDQSNSLNRKTKIALSHHDYWRFSTAAMWHGIIRVVVSSGPKVA
jgi:hypothetical protein